MNILPKDNMIDENDTDIIYEEPYKVNPIVGMLSGIHTVVLL